MLSPPKRVRNLSLVSIGIFEGVVWVRSWLMISGVDLELIRIFLTR